MQGYKIEGRYIHGSSYVIHMDNVDFMTWRLNDETNEYWVKFHYSNKEVRVRVTPNQLKELVHTWANEELDINIGEKDDMDY
jgi:hypothetical protein